MRSLPKSSARLRFESFELAPLKEQPTRRLSLLASRRGEFVIRIEIQRTLSEEEDWFVVFDHAVNSATMNTRTKTISPVTVIVIWKGQPR